MSGSFVRSVQVGTCTLPFNETDIVAVSFINGSHENDHISMQELTSSGETTPNLTIILFFMSSLPAHDGVRLHHNPITPRILIDSSKKE